MLFDRVACAHPPTKLDPAREEIVRQHCRDQRAVVGTLIEGWLKDARPFFAAQTPFWLPQDVFYPFGGSDLVTLLTLFPRARHFTSISLEASGDPRALDALEPEELTEALQMHLDRLERQFTYGHSRTDNLLLLTRGPLSSELSFNLVALVVHGCEPVDLRFFEILPDGQLRAVRRSDAREIDTLHAERKGTRGVALRQLFSHMELTFRCQDAPEKVRRYRHVRADLSDRGLASEPGVLAFLQRQPPSAGVLKAASYLIQMDNFRTIRRLMLQQCDWIISDATGPLPSQAEAAGFWQETFGSYSGSFLPHAKNTDEELSALWSRQPSRPMPVRFGYPDASRRDHLMITRRRHLPRPRALCPRSEPWLAGDAALFERAPHREASGRSDLGADPQAPANPLATTPAPQPHARRSGEPGPKR